jgi:hypothetical protein
MYSVCCIWNSCSCWWLPVFVKTSCIILFIIIIIIGLTALRGPWSSSETPASWSIPPLLLQISWQESFPTPRYPRGPMFSVRAVSLSWLVPILKRQDLAFAFAWLSRINVAQEPWRGHACNGLGRSKWHYLNYVSIHLSARCVPSRPRTTHCTVIILLTNCVCPNVIQMPRENSIALH